MEIEYEKLADGLVYYKNVINNPGQIINLIENLDLKMQQDSIKDPYIKLKTSLRVWDSLDSNKLFFCKQKFITRSSELKEDDIYYNEYKTISDSVFDGLDKAFNHYSTVLYPFAGKFIKGSVSHLGILKYTESGHLPEHSDEANTRVLSAVTYLNDDYVGGEINFPNVNVKIKPESGSIVFFPTNFVFTHEVFEIKSGTRYSLPFWYKSTSGTSK